MPGDKKDHATLPDGAATTTHDPDALVSATYRLPQSILDRLGIASAQRKAQKRDPASQQDIVAAALDKWLREHGC